MMKKERALKAVEILKELYPDAICSLTASNPFELLVAVRLSAQCTDARVNIVTPALFDRYKRLRIMQVQMLKILKNIYIPAAFIKARQNQSSEWRKGFYPILTVKFLIRLKN